MTDAVNIREVVSAGADWIGFIFHPQSPRYVGAAASPSAATPCPCPSDIKVTKVGVFVDASVQEIIARVACFGLDMIQLHGHETPVMMRNLRLTMDSDIRRGLKMIKAIGISSAADMEQCRDYNDCADYLLFDTRCDIAGGCGRHFDWSAIDAYRGDLPFLLSGGISPGDVQALAAMRHPKMAGIDLNSRFETSPGIKDAAAVGRFIRELSASHAP